MDTKWRPRIVRRPEPTSMMPIPNGPTLFVSQYERVVSLHHFPRENEIGSVLLHLRAGPAALYQVSAANRRDIHTNCCGHMSTPYERPRYAVFRSLMPETAALLLEWVKDKQPEDYLFPAGRLSAVPHVGRIRFYQVSVPIAEYLHSNDARASAAVHAAL